MLEQTKDIMACGMQVERLQRDADPYTAYAMASLTSTIAAAVPVLLQKVCTAHAGCAAAVL